MKVIKVLFADDHPLVRAGIRAILEISQEIKIIAEFENGKELVDALPFCKADMLILDIEMPVMSGIEVIQTLRSAGNTIPILILSAYADDLYVKETFALGVNGYLLKSEISQRIIEAIKAVASGEHGWVSPAIHRILFQNKSTAKEFSYTKQLTEREQDILTEVKQGKTNKEIANVLTISEHTVKNHLSHIFKKLGIKHRYQMMR